MAKSIYKHQVDAAGEFVLTRNARTQYITAIAGEVRSAVDAGAAELPGALGARMRGGTYTHALRV